MPAATRLQSFPPSRIRQPPRRTPAPPARPAGPHPKLSSGLLSECYGQVWNQTPHLSMSFKCFPNDLQVKRQNICVVYFTGLYLYFFFSPLTGGPHPPSPSMPRSPGHGTYPGRRRKEGPPLVMMFPCVPCGRDVELGEKGLTDCLRNLTLERIVER